MGIDGIAVVVDLDQIGRAHFMEQNAVAVDQKVPFLTRHPSRNVRVDQIGHSKMRHQPVQCCQVATGFPLVIGNQAAVELKRRVVHRGSLFD